jgi:hypothetical protein
MTYKFRAIIESVEGHPTQEYSALFKKRSLAERMKGNPTVLLYQTVQLLSRAWSAELFQSSTFWG